MKYEFTTRQYIGTRNRQEDYLIVDDSDESIFAAVLDGMGGLNSGNIASSLAGKTLLEEFRIRNKDENIKDFYIDMVDILDERISTLKNNQNAKLKCGTTLCSVYIQDEKLNWLSIGDSRLYIIRNNEIVQATQDLNYKFILDNQYNSGLLTNEKYRSELKNGESLVSFIGMGGISLYDINTNPLKVITGDYILLTTDGLYKAVDKEKIIRIINRGSNINEIADNLLDLSKLESVYGQDNTSYILIKIL